MDKLAVLFIVLIVGLAALFFYAPFKAIELYRKVFDRRKDDNCGGTIGLDKSIERRRKVEPLPKDED